MRACCARRPYCAWPQESLDTRAPTADAQGAPPAYGPGGGTARPLRTPTRSQPSRNWSPRQGALLDASSIVYRARRWRSSDFFHKLRDALAACQATGPIGRSHNLWPQHWLRRRFRKAPESRTRDDLGPRDLGYLQGDPPAVPIPQVYACATLALWHRECFDLRNIAASGLWALQPRTPLGQAGPAAPAGPRHCDEFHMPCLPVFPCPWIGIGMGGNARPRGCQCTGPRQ